MLPCLLSIIIVYLYLFTGQSCPVKYAAMSVYSGHKPKHSVRAYVYAFKYCMFTVQLLRRRKLKGRQIWEKDPGTLSTSFAFIMTYITTLHPQCPRTPEIWNECRSPQLCQPHCWRLDVAGRRTLSFYRNVLIYGVHNLQCHRGGRCGSFQPF